MLDTLTGSENSITWKMTVDGIEPFSMTFNSDGTAKVGSRLYNFSISPSGNAAYPVAFIAQTPNPVTANENQVYSGLCNAEKGAGFTTGDWPNAQPGNLNGFSMSRS